jgi:putative Holliday junction resolvase
MSPSGPGRPGRPARETIDYAGLPDGVWIGVDVGSVRVGVARSDPSGILASPERTLARVPGREQDLLDLAQLIAEHEAVGVVIGLPQTLAGRAGSAVESARAYGSALAAMIAGIPIVYVDERMTTVVAERNLTRSGVRGRAKRALIDQAAAVEILQSFLDRRRSA